MLYAIPLLENRPLIRGFISLMIVAFANYLIFLPLHHSGFFGMKTCKTKTTNNQFFEPFFFPTEQLLGFSRLYSSIIWLGDWLPLDCTHFFNSVILDKKRNWKKISASTEENSTSTLPTKRTQNQSKTKTN